MSVENDGSDISLVCDECGDTTKTYHRSDFDEMVYAARRAGWKIENRRGVYRHTCPSCCSELAEFGLEVDD